jgi:hypothetical protein
VPLPVYRVGAVHFVVVCEIPGFALRFIQVLISGDLARASMKDTVDATG